MKTIHIAIAGNIGSGKTTLARILGKIFNCKVHFEEADDENPYLDDFYLDMSRWSFNLQMFFLSSRLKQIKVIQKSGEKMYIQDRSIYEDAQIFAPHLHEIGRMLDKDFKTYESHFDLMTEQISTPDILIYLRANVPTLVRNIENRGRESEKNMSIKYLMGLNDRYDDLVKTYTGPTITVNVDEIDFVGNQDHLKIVITEICNKLKIEIPVL